MTTATSILNTLRTAVLANPAAKVFLQAGDVQGLKSHLNGPSNQQAWKVKVLAADVFSSLTISTYDNLTAGKRDAFSLLLRMAEAGLLDVTKTPIRNGLADIFAVTGGYSDATQLAKMLNGACIEFATHAEVLYGFTTPAAVGGVTAIRRAQILNLDDVDISLLIFNDDGTIRTS